MTVSIQMIAEACGVSTATVSRTLAGQRYVRAELRERILKKAEQLGYSRNRLLGSLMSHVRTSSTERFVGNLALVHVDYEPKRDIGPQLHRIIESSQQRSRELGFGSELHRLGPGIQEQRALARVLKARGMLGALLFFPRAIGEPKHFLSENLSYVALDFAHIDPKLDTVCHDHYTTLKRALDAFHSAGYQRIGLYIERFKDQRTNCRWTSALHSYQYNNKSIGNVPPLSPEQVTRENFLAWFDEHQPDLVIGHFDQCIEWIMDRGKRVPEDVGFFGLNTLDCRQPCAAVDPQLELQGRVAAETLIAHIHNNECGIPEQPRLILVRGKLCAGPTARGLEIDSLTL